MKALILAAGRGHRLWPFTAECPKCMLSLAEGESILEHQLANLEIAGIDNAVLICGFGLEQIREKLRDRKSGMAVRTVYNPFYAVADNLISLWSARSEMEGDFLLLNGDNVFHPDIVRELLCAEGDCCIAVRAKREFDTDDMKVQLEGDAVVGIGKNLAPDRRHGQSVGVMKFTGRGVSAIRRSLEDAVTELGAIESLFTDALQRMIAAGHRARAVDIGSLPWADVDTPDDLKFARENLRLFSLPRPGVSRRRAVGEPA
jgi:choline kinase